MRAACAADLLWQGVAGSSMIWMVMEAHALRLMQRLAWPGLQMQNVSMVVAGVSSRLAGANKQRLS